jgi:hypothetical protein
MDVASNLCSACRLFASGDAAVCVVDERAQLLHDRNACASSGKLAEMTERAPIVPPEPEADQADRGESTVSAKRPPGRPRGTDYRRVDAPLHQQMRRLLENGVVHSRTAAARQVVSFAYGHGCEDSKIRRLVQSFPY